MTDRCSTRCDHDSQCALPGDHEPADRHETDHGCICYDPRDKALNDALSGEADAVRRAESAEIGCEIAYRRRAQVLGSRAEHLGSAHSQDTAGGCHGRCGVSHCACPSFKAV